MCIRPSAPLAHKGLFYFALTFITIIVCVYMMRVCGHVCHAVHVEVRGQLRGVSSTSTFTWVPWMELGSPAGRASVYQLSHLTPQGLLLLNLTSQSHVTKVLPHIFVCGLPTILGLSVV